MSSILRQIEKPSIKLNELSVEQIDYNISNNKEQTGLKSQKTIGLDYPLIKINNYQFKKEEIVYFEIDCTAKIPKLTLTVKFLGNTHNISRNYPKDGDRVSVFIQSNDDSLKPIRNDYVIRSLNSNFAFNNYRFGNLVTIRGELFIPKILKNEVFSKNDTSFNVLKEISKILNLGFVSNVTNTDDKQIWLNPKDNYFNFIQKIVERSFLNDNTFFDWFIDVYYNLNFVEVNSILEEENNFKFKQIVNDLMIYELETTENKRKSLLPKVLTNYDLVASTPMFITNFKVENKSEIINEEIGYKLFINFFEHSTKKFYDIFEEGLIKEGSEENKILLRGKPNEDYFKNYVKNIWSGIQYSLPKHNVHKNYMFSIIHNHFNKAILDKLNLVVNIDGVNLNFIRGDSVPVFILNVSNDLENRYGFSSDEIQKMRKEFKNFSFDEFPSYNRFLSGNYFLKGFKIVWDSSVDSAKNRRFSENIATLSTQTSFKTTMILTRREWDLPSV